MKGGYFMSETKVKNPNTKTNVEKRNINNSNGHVIIRDSRPKLDTSAINHGGTISNSSGNKNKNKNQK